MTEKKLNPATKKAASSGSSKPRIAKSSPISGKPKTAKAPVAAPAKNAAVKKPAAKKPAAKKTSARPDKTQTTAVKKAADSASREKTPVKKSTVKKAATTKTKPTRADKLITRPTPEERYRMVETAAYFIAERHGFQGRADEHWAAAEREIAARLGC